MKFSKISFLGLILAATPLVGCGNSKDSVDVTVNIGVPVRAPNAFRLNNNLMDLMSITIGQDCYQDQVQLVVYDVALDKMIAHKKAYLRSVYSGTPPSITNGATSSDINTYITRMAAPYLYLDEPLSIAVPKGREVEIALMGAFYNPSNLSGQTCIQRVGTFATGVASFIGHKPVTSSILSSRSMNLGIHTVIANPTVPYDGVGTAANIINFPKKKDFIQTDAGGTPTSTTVTLERVHWLPDENGNYLIHQDVDYAAYTAGAKNYLVHMYPMRLEFKYVGSNPSACQSINSSCTGLYHVDILDDSLVTNVTLILDTALTNSPNQTQNMSFNINNY